MPLSRHAIALVLGALVLTGCKSPTEVPRTGDEPARFEGTVLASDGSPLITSVSMTLSSGEKGASEKVYTARTSPKGNFAFDFSAGDLQGQRKGVISVTSESGAKLVYNCPMQYLHQVNKLPAFQFWDSLMTPEEGAALAGDAVFNWKPSERPAEYTVDIRRNGAPFWSEHTQDTSLTLPAYLFDGKSAYEWDVTAGGAEIFSTTKSRKFSNEGGAPTAAISAISDHTGQEWPTYHDGEYDQAEKLLIPNSELTEKHVHLKVDLGEEMAVSRMLLYGLEYDGPGIAVRTGNPDIPLSENLAVINYGTDLDLDLKGVSARYLYLDLPSFEPELPEDELKGLPHMLVCRVDMYTGEHDCGDRDTYTFTLRELRIIKAE